MKHLVASFLKILLPFALIYSVPVREKHISALKNLTAKLQSGSWVNDNVDLTFYNNGKFDLVTAVEGGDESGSGHFKVLGNNRLLLVFSQPDSNEPEAHKWQGPFKIHCNYVVSSIGRWPESLKCEERELTFQNTKCPHKRGARVQYSGIETVMMNERGRLTSNTKIRVKPSPLAETTDYCFGSKVPKKSGHASLACAGYLPKGHAVVVIFRTSKKNKVQQWVNYWYFVQYKTHYYDESGDSIESTTKENWVFGEFVQIE